MTLGFGLEELSEILKSFCRHLQLSIRDVH